jgi:hypothetical protein
VGEFGVELGFELLQLGDGERCDFDCDVLDVFLSYTATLKHKRTLAGLSALGLSLFRGHYVFWCGVDLVMS